jgi:hypothetical protein
MVQRQIARQEAGLLLTEDRTGDAVSGVRQPLMGTRGHQAVAPLHFEAPVPFNGAGGIGTSPAFRVHVGREHRLPSNEEASNPWFDRLTSDRVHSFVSLQNRAETALLLRLRTSNPDWSDCCENGSDVITAKLQAQHLQVGAVHGADETKGNRDSFKNGGVVKQTAKL